MRFRKKPVEIEAQHFDGSGASAAAILFWIGSSPAALVAAEAGQRLAYVDGSGVLFIRTLESGKGYHVADPGDWIICGIKGEFYPCKPDIFAGSYDAVPIGCSSMVMVPFSGNLVCEGDAGHEGDHGAKLADGSRATWKDVDVAPARCPTASTSNQGACPRV